MGVKLGFLWIFKGHNHGDNHQFKWLAVFPIGLQRLQPKKSEEAVLIVPSGPFQFYGLFYKIPFFPHCQWHFMSTGLFILSQEIRNLKFEDWENWLAYLFLFMSLFFTICPDNKHRKSCNPLFCRCLQI